MAIIIPPWERLLIEILSILNATLVASSKLEVGLKRRRNEKTKQELLIGALKHPWRLTSIIFYQRPEFKERYVH